MAFFELYIDVFIRNGAGTVACVVSDVFSGPSFDVFRDTRMAEPVHSRISKRFGFLRLALRTKAINGIIKTALDDVADMCCIGHWALAAMHREE